MYHTFDWIEENSWNEKDWKKFEFSLEKYYDYNSESQSEDLHNYSLYVAPANIKEIKEGWVNLPSSSTSSNSRSVITKEPNTSYITDNTFFEDESYW